MNGIDNIKNKILSEAEAEAAKLEAEAKELAGAKAAEAAEQLSKDKSSILERGARLAKLSAERIVSSAAKEQRTKALAVKQELIGEVFEEAKAELEKLPDADYRKLLVKLIGQNSDSGREEVLFPAADAAIAADIVSQVNAETGKALTVSKDCAAVSKGVILRDGDVEINLSLANIAEQMREELTPAVAKLLFG